MNTFKIGKFFENELKYDLLNEACLIDIKNVALRCCNKIFCKWYSYFTGSILKDGIKTFENYKNYMMLKSKVENWGNCRNCEINLFTVSKWLKKLNNIMNEGGDNEQKICDVGHIL